MSLDEKLRFAINSLPEKEINNLLFVDFYEEGECLLNAFKQEFNGNVDILTSLSEELPNYQSESIDLVISIDSIKKWNNPEIVFVELSRIIRPKGCLLLIFEQYPRSKRNAAASEFANYDGGMMLPNGEISYSPSSIKVSLRKICGAQGYEFKEIINETHVYENWESILAIKEPYNELLNRSRYKRIKEYSDEYLIRNHLR